MANLVSDQVSVVSGVPQGSVLGPCLFLLFINDLAQDLESTVRLFADDTIAYLVVDSQQDAHRLQRDLDRLGEWEEKWQMEFHPDKCQVLRVTKKTSPPHRQTLHPTWPHPGGGRLSKIPGYHDLRGP